MPEQRWKAVADVVVAGKAVAAGTTFTAPVAAVRDALAAGLVERPPKGGKR